MYVTTDSLDTEMRMAVEAAVDLTNALDEGGEREDLRRILVDHQYRRAAEATDGEVDDVERRFPAVAQVVRVLTGNDLPAAVSSLNETIGQYGVAPSLQAHDGSPLHIHWSESSTRFAEQVVIDILMALAQTLCDVGLERFGICAAEDCSRVYFDTTRNLSRRFCNDPRCASRTHTAAHRARMGASD